MEEQWKGQLRFATLVDEHGNQKLAHLLNVSNATISHWKAGRRTPGINDLVALAQALGFSLDQLTGLEPAPPRPTSPLPRRLRALVTVELLNTPPDTA